MKLIIVESPTKAKTISKFISKDYKVESSFGHIRDLPKSEMGIDIENDFTPEYVIPLKSRKTVANLKALAKKAEKIILASDEDREGEAIAWHLAEALKLNKSQTQRIVFHEITKPAILKAIENPREINSHLVDAQQARRVLDRLVGYELSPFLWKKVARGLSAGRVQSVAVRLIVEREREIKAFKAEEYWSVSALLARTKEKDSQFETRLHKINGKTVEKLQIKNEVEADKILSDLKGAEYKVAEVVKKEGTKNPPRPFTTSTLQQTANRWLGFSAKQTMTLAQRLYETGLITYMRTDSVNLSEKFLADAGVYLNNALGGEYALKTPNRYKTKSKGAQEAHEAIRPTEAADDPESVKDKLESGQYRLYKLIWQRSIASQMPPAKVDATTIDVDAEKDGRADYQFRATGQVIKFDGYLKIYPEKSAEIELPEVEVEEALDLIKLSGEEHFTKPPARYSDAGLVKVLEKYGIGRPSTYAPTIATIETRNYMERDENKKLKPTDIAFVVNDLLVAHFPNIVDFQFTAGMENNLDEIAEGRQKWQPVIGEFYVPFHDNLIKKQDELKKSDIIPEEKSEEVCEKCGSAMIIKTGRWGKYLACSNFPECKNIKSLPKAGVTADPETEAKLKALQEKYKDEVCEKCGSAMVIKNGRFGPFLACSGYPKCKNIKSITENSGSTGIKCPVCGEGEIVMKRSRRGPFYACNRYPDCKTSFSSKPTGEKCPDCGALLLEAKDGGVKCSAKGCGYKTA
ncbi:MAG: type I DNA topoisomerase [Patescibacteria group bacterium]|jgi:DNA topoisomerase-1